jgi:hypothetical protein
MQFGQRQRRWVCPAVNGPLCWLVCLVCDWCYTRAHRNVSSSGDVMSVIVADWWEMAAVPPRRRDRDSKVEWEVNEAVQQPSYHYSIVFSESSQLASKKTYAYTFRSNKHPAPLLHPTFPPLHFSCTLALCLLSSLPQSDIHPGI